MTWGCGGCKYPVSLKRLDSQCRSAAGVQDGKRGEGWASELSFESIKGGEEDPK